MNKNSSLFIVKLFAKLFFILWMFYSCKQKSIPQKDLNTTIDYNNIDLYPVLPECDNVKTDQQKKCFYQAISKRISHSFAQKKLHFKNPVSDSIVVNFTIDTIGLVHVTKIKHHPVPRQKKQIDSIILNSFSTLPKMKPAVKIGIPVKAAFNIPIIIDPNNTKTDL